MNYFEAVSSQRRRSTGATDPYWANVSILLHMDGTDGSTNFIEFKNGYTPTVSGSCRITSSDYMFGGGAMYGDGTTDYISWRGAYGNVFEYGTGDYTIECWAKLQSWSGSSFRCLMDQRLSGNGFYPTIYLQDNGTIFFYFNSGNRIISSTNVFQTGSWKHVALARSGTSTKLFVNGTQVGSTYTDGAYYTGSGQIMIGKNTLSATQDWVGWIDEFRITKGVARYTSNFTTSSTAFPNQ